MIALLHVVTVLNAATITSAAGGGTWTTKNTWIGRVVPTLSDIVVIATTGTSTVTMTNPATCAGITVNSGSILAPNANILTVNGIVNNHGTINITTGQINQSGTGDFTNNGTITFSGTGLLTLTGSYTNTGTLTLGATPVTITGANAAASTVAGFTTTGLVTYSRTAGSTTFTGNVSASALTLNASGGILNLGTALNHTFSGLVTLTAGTLDGGSSNLNANLTGGTAWSKATAAIFTPSSGTVTLGGGAQTINGTGSTTFNNLTISGSGTKTLTTVPAVNGILSMEGPATATISAEITMGTSSTLQYKGSESRTTGIEFPATYNSTGGVIFDQGTGNTVTLNASKTIQNGLLNIKSGTLDLSTFTINRSTSGGSLTIASDATLRIGGTNSLPSNYATNSFDINSTVLFNGSGAQSIGGSLSTIFGNLTLDNTSDVTLDFDQAVNGALTLTNGLLNTGSNTLTVGCSGSIANASAARYVNGKLALAFCSTGARVFHIGKGGNYLPLTLNFSALTGTSTVTAEQIESTLPGTIPSDIDIFSSRYWQLSQTGGSSYSFNLTLDGTGWSPTSFLKMLKGDGSSNAHHAVTTPNYTNSTAFTSFGNFGLGQLNCVTWLGTTSDWYTTSNWTSETLPTSTDDIRIPSAVSFYPSISGTNFTLASAGKLQILAGANVTLESGPVLTFQSGATVTTGVGSKIVLKSDAKYLNLSASTPTLEVQRQLTGTKGWRMLASPVATTFSDMFKAPLVTQGYTDPLYSDLQPNLMWWDESEPGTTLQSWRKPANLTDNTLEGKGYFHYCFNAAEMQSVLGVNTGIFYPDALPITMSTTGIEHFNGSGYFNYTLTNSIKPSQTPTVGNDYTYLDQNAMDEGWNLIGNPTASYLDWDAVAAWTKTDIDDVIYVWDPSTLEYKSWNGTAGLLGDGVVPPFQAFWVHASGASPALSFSNDAKTSTTATFLRRAKADSTITIPITMTVGDLKTTSYISFGENGVTGPDRWDAYRLEPMSENRLDLYTLSSSEFVSPLVINNLPLPKDELVSIPLYCDATIAGSGQKNNFTLKWELPVNWPSEWKINIQDNKTEETLSMNEHSMYSFSAENNLNLSASVGKLPMPQKLIQQPNGASLLRSSTSLPPFSIVLSKGSEINYLAPKPTLTGNYPNPFKTETTIRFSLPEKAKANLEVYSAQGLKIAVLADGLFSAGITEVQWNAASIPPGIYYIRFKSGESVETKKAILIN